MRTRWLSVPPVISSAPLRTNPSASARAFATIWAAYAANEGWRASDKAMALAAITWGSGPPRTIGHPLSTYGAYSSVQSTSPPRGPRSDLWVVEVTTSAQGTGSRSPVRTFPATSPATWAMSTMKLATTSWAISARVASLGFRGSDAYAAT